ncbi:hypothetical protein HEP_00101400 [Hepatocystis sp. ex Piliocolobus tephrosceles]|nr:hypothetical protein HEP_00101400 [Hepatocystis sp. ex Piliocolobus tephrosceles]
MSSDDESPFSSGNLKNILQNKHKQVQDKWENYVNDVFDLTHCDLQQENDTISIKNNEDISNENIYPCVPNFSSTDSHENSEDSVSITSSSDFSYVVNKTAHMSNILNKYFSTDIYDENRFSGCTKTLASMVKQKKVKVSSPFDGNRINHFGIKNINRFVDNDVKLKFVNNLIDYYRKLQKLVCVRVCTQANLIQKETLMMELKKTLKKVIQVI